MSTIRVLQRCCVNQESLCRKGFLATIGLIAGSIFILCITAVLSLITWGINIQNEGFENPKTLGQSFRYTFLFTIVPLVSLIVPSLIGWGIWGYYNDEQATLHYFFRKFCKITLGNNTIKNRFVIGTFYIFLFFYWYFWAAVWNLPFGYYKKPNASYQNHMMVTVFSVYLNTINSVLLTIGTVILVFWSFSCYIDAQEEIENDIEMQNQTIQPSDQPSNQSSNKLGNVDGTNSEDSEVVVIQREDADSDPDNEQRESEQRESEQRESEQRESEQRESEPSV